MLIMRGNCELIWWDKKETGTIITSSTVHIGVEQSKTTKSVAEKDAVNGHHTTCQGIHSAGMNTNGRQMYFDAYRESTQIRAQIVSGRCAFSWKFNSIPDLQIRPFSYERVEITVQFRGIVSTL